jgi:RNA polymerase sigma-70 factor, ECF subfamily
MSINRSLRPTFLLDEDELCGHVERLYRAALVLCGRREDAEDLVQDTLVKVMRRPRWIRQGDARGYLLKTLRNTWIDGHRSRPRLELVTLDELVHEPIDLGADPVAAVEARAVLAAVRDLGELHREVIVAVDIMGLSYKEAARALGAPEGTIMSRLFRSRQQVARALETRSGPAARE